MWSKDWFEARALLKTFWKNDSFLPFSGFVGTNPFAPSVPTWNDQNNINDDNSNNNNNNNNNVCLQGRG